jgi:hypothetical protein
VSRDFYWAILGRSEDLGRGLSAARASVPLQWAGDGRFEPCRARPRARSSGFSREIVPVPAHPLASGARARERRSYKHLVANRPRELIEYRAIIVPCAGPSSSFQGF